MVTGMWMKGPCSWSPLDEKRVSGQKIPRDATKQFVDLA